MIVCSILGKLTIKMPSETTEAVQPTAEPKVEGKDP